MTEPTTVYGVWEHDWENDDLIGLYWTREKAEAKAESGSTRGPGYAPRWTVEEHAIPGPLPGEGD